MDPRSHARATQNKHIRTITMHHTKRILSPLIRCLWFSEMEWRLCCRSVRLFQLPFQLHAY